MRQEIHNTSLTFRCLKLQSGWGRPVINSPPNIILFFKKNIQVWSLYSLQFCTPQVLVLILKTLTPKFEVVMFLEDSWQVSCYNLPTNRFVINWMLLQIKLFTTKTNLRFPFHSLQTISEMDGTWKLGASFYRTRHLHSTYLSTTVWVSFHVRMSYMRNGIIYKVKHENDLKYIWHNSPASQVYAGFDLIFIDLFLIVFCSFTLNLSKFLFHKLFSLVENILWLWISLKFDR